VIDDHADVRALVCDYLRDHAFEATAVGTAREGMAHALRGGFDIVLLDLNLPDGHGFDVAREIRHGRDIPIIFLTARNDEIDRVVGLETAGDDYVTKPFSPRELVARIRAVLRRRRMAGGSASNTSRGAGPVRYRFAGWTLSRATRRLTAPSGNVITLTSGEYALLVAFLARPRHVLTRDQLLTATRMEDDIFDRSIDVQVARLRRKLVDPSCETPLIRTERGAGYALDADVEAS